VHSFRYHGGSLHCEGVALAGVAEKYGTLLYVYSAGTILDHYRRLDSALGNIEHLLAPRMQKGDAVIFPSFTLHRVTPVLSGIRIVLSAWISGPPLR
jgi:hypothetical protein